MQHLLQNFQHSAISFLLGLEELNLILDALLAYAMITFTTEDHKEAARAFIEKRKPKFQGK